MSNNAIDNLNKIINKTDLFMKSMDKIGGKIRDDARLLAPVGDSGDLRRSLFTETKKIDGGYITTIATNSDHAIYVEFGTGPKGEENHDGVSPEINVRYKQRGWMIPVDKISQKTAEKYHFIPIKKDGEIIGYFTHGQSAQPFLYPAFRNNEKYIIKKLSESALEIIKEGQSND